MRGVWVCGICTLAAIAALCASRSEPSSAAAQSQAPSHPASRPAKPAPPERHGQGRKAPPAPESQPDKLSFLPAGAAAVEANRQRFAQPASDPVLSLPAGTVADDLADLAGCWGAFANPGSADKAGLEADAEFYDFDFTAKRITYQVLQRSRALGGMTVSLEHVYTFEVTAPDRITARLTSMSAGSTLAGSPSVRNQPVASATPIVLQVTRVRDAFKFGNSLDASSDWSKPHRSFLLFRRFECPTPTEAHPTTQKADRKPRP
jgi:hypothetical protein